MKKQLAIYAGSFNPMHVGHMNIFEKAKRLFGDGNVVLAIGCNPEKAKDRMDEYKKEQEERANTLSERLNTKVIPYFNFLDEFIIEKEKEGYDVFLVRGLRNGEDLSHEDNQIRFIEDFLNFLEIEYELKTVFFRCDPKYDHISSSAIRAIDSFGENGFFRSKKYKV